VLPRLPVGHHRPPLLGNDDRAVER
jgi:hypothetical protein